MESKRGPKTIDVKPMGGPGGGYWDDGIYDGIREISVEYGPCIAVIRTLYDKDGKPILCFRHGSNVGSHYGDKTFQVVFQYPDEFLIAVKGHYSMMEGFDTPFIRSLTFESNQRTFGPFGQEEGTPFSFQVEDGDKIIGFQGRSGFYLDAIGFHVASSRKDSSES